MNAASDDRLEPRALSQGRASEPAGTLDDPRVMRAVEEYLAVREAGGKPDRQEFLARNAEIAEALAECLEGLEYIQQAGSFIQQSEENPRADGSAGAEISVGTPLGDFRILREIGRGGMGVVYEAEQLSLARRVALKILPFLAALEPKQLQRFKNEAQAAAHLHHTNIVPVFAVGCERGVHFYAMQYIEGQTLAAVIQQWRGTRGEGREKNGEKGIEGLRTTLNQAKADTPLAPHHSPLATRFRTVAQLGIQAAEALDYAHREEVVHRDIKPANLLVDVHGNLWITDFGLARFHNDAGLTMTGDVMGTLRYMSPEQAQGQRGQVDHRTDIYSLGATLYELLALEPAFPGGDRHDLLRRIAWDEPAPLRRHNKAIPQEIETIVLKAMAKSPAERYGTARELADDLRCFLEHKPIRARRPGLWQRVKKWAWRHRPLVMSAGVSTLLVLVLAVVGLAVSTVMITRALQAEKQAKDDMTRTLYYQRIALAEREAATNHWGRVDELLNQCPEDLRGWEWYYLKRLRHRSPLVLKASHFLAISPDGRRLAAGGNLTSEKRNEFMVWDIATGQLLFTGRGHTDIVAIMVFSPDGCRLASMSADKTVRVWDLTSSPGKGAVIAPELTLVGHTDKVHGLAYSPDGKRLASISYDQTVRLWDAQTGKQLRCFPGTTAQFAFLGLSFSPDGQHLASGSGDREVKVWDVKTGHVVHTLHGHEEPVFNVRFSPDGRRLASVCLGLTFKLWDLTTEQEVLTLRGAGNGLTGVAFDPVGQRVAVVNDMGGFARIFDAANGQELIKLEGHTDCCVAVAFSPDGQRLVTASLDKTVKVWDATTGQEALTLYGHPNEVYAVRFSPDGRRLVSGSKYDGTVRVWDAPRRDDDLLAQALTWSGFTGPVLSVAFSPDSRFLASGSADRTVRVWDTVDGREIWMVHGHTDKVHAVAFSPNGRRLASAGLDNTIKFWEPDSGKELKTVFDSARHTFSLSFHPDGGRLAVTCIRSVKVRDAKTGKEDLSFPAHTGPGVHNVVFSPDGKQLATAGADGLAKTWDATTGAILRTLSGHTHHRLWGLAYSPDGRFLATGGKDQTARIWDLATGKELFTLGGHLDQVTSVAYSPDGRRLASGSGAEVKIWDPATGHEITTLRGHAGLVYGVAFSPDGQRLAVASGYAGKGEVRIWNKTAFRKEPGEELAFTEN
ncbi:MAG TPA: protein kinase [Gemmataceae bacterium]|nr:protein kinase [Gemmataceae bacterium]